MITRREKMPAQSAERTFPHVAINRLAATRRGARWPSIQPAFTLFEVILAIALSSLLLVIIGMAIQLYLTRIETRRNEVEWSQLARSIFAMIGDDLRAASEYKPQDTSGALAAAEQAFNAGNIDNPNSGGGGMGGAGGAGSGGSGSAFGGSSSTGGSSTSGSGTGMSSLSGSSTQTSLTTTPGVHGTLNELIIDVSRPLRLDELFGSHTGYTNVAAVNPVTGQSSNTMGGTTASMSVGSGLQTSAAHSDLKTIRYAIRQGEAVDANSPAVTSLATAEAQARAGGLVRQAIDRAQRLWAEEVGDQTTLQSGQRLIAPEVARIEFRYFDGSTVLESWDMEANGQLPLAIEVRLWLAPPEVVNSAEVAVYGSQAVIANSREFRQTIYLPMAQPPSTASTTSTGMSQ